MEMVLWSLMHYPICRVFMIAAQTDWQSAVRPPGCPVLNLHLPRVSTSPGHAGKWQTSCRSAGCKPLLGSWQARRKSGRSSSVLKSRCSVTPPVPSESGTLVSAPLLSAQTQEPDESFHHPREGVSEGLKKCPPGCWKNGDVACRAGPIRRGGWAFSNNNDKNDTCVPECSLRFCNATSFFMLLTTSKYPVL